MVLNGLMSGGVEFKDDGKGDSNESGRVISIGKSECFHSGTNGVCRMVEKVALHVQEKEISGRECKTTKKV